MWGESGRGGELGELKEKRRQRRKRRRKGTQETGEEICELYFEHCTSTSICGEDVSTHIHKDIHIKILPACHKPIHSSLVRAVFLYLLGLSASLCLFIHVIPSRCATARSAVIIVIHMKSVWISECLVLSELLNRGSKLSDE